MLLLAVIVFIHAIQEKYMRLDKNILLLIIVTAAFLVLLFLINQEAKTIDYEPKTYVKETHSDNRKIPAVIIL